ncbi:MAG: Gfo/Idh/MocA family oxidoreductase [Akkermansiaceae bacterium]|jgi:predicted dehydrogenase|nr:Gfo/Idh/MocA family oxidoreductase [Akkermansiaceae bacterium]
MFPPTKLSRRDCLKQALITGAAFTILPSRLLGEDAPSKRVNIAMIGTGRQGTQVNLKTFLGMNNVRVVAVCDVDRLRMNYAKSLVDTAYGNKDCRAFSDFREAYDLPGLDAVMISTTDHWHAIQSLMALKKGLHVCCEKAMTRYFEEGRALADAARKSGLVFRLDSECRSNAYMIKTADLAMNGYLGTIRRFEIGVPQEKGKGFGDATPMPVPEHLDYEMWQGPAPERPYTVDRVHETDLKTGEFVGRPGWMRISDYCAGMICNWGGHLLDVANLINGTSHSGPVRVEGAGTFPPAGSLWDTSIGFELQYRFANGVKLDYKIDQPYLRVEGDEGWIQAHWHSEGGLQAHDRNIFRTKLRDTDKQVPTRSDKQDFIEAILNGTPVMIDAETGHRVNSQCLLGLAAIHSGKALDWDPVAEKITNHPEAAAHMTGTYRDPWDLKKFI